MAQPAREAARTDDGADADDRGDHRGEHDQEVRARPARVGRQVEQRHVEHVDRLIAAPTGQVGEAEAQERDRGAGEPDRPGLEHGHRPHQAPADRLHRGRGRWPRSPRRGPAEPDLPRVMERAAEARDHRRVAGLLGRLVGRRGPVAGRGVARRDRLARGRARRRARRGVDRDQADLDRQRRRGVVGLDPALDVLAPVALVDVGVAGQIEPQLGVVEELPLAQERLCVRRAQADLFEHRG
ncbi:MAG: hypothetical protein IPL61_32745 [Myxococcales bacterium]|nr:hypothetical protein [Myxococcales bacterium]